ncbi:NAD(P)-dependent oxidoreductase [Streptomyces sp. NRRL B-24085]|uniref:NAD-dependent epimerase/dehydratase family protein n=1 Tax=Streptomyces sp. NRRL B-24085 TaxID=1709476 RepID=UPI0006B35EA5|nr:NAD-dependent epimerase/dehydratase family protein [Streptomyces sp. NRRL B-24085]
MRPLRVVLTGATGFVGGAVLDRLLRDRADGRDLEVRALVRGVPADRREQPGVRWRRADLADPASVEGAASGADVLVHLAARVDGTEQECERTNVGGTRAVVEEARRAGVRRIVHLSTAAVYGPGPHRGIPVDGVTPAPVSAASRTRLAAERIAREAGAVVLRPGLVLGAGDRWVVPGLRELLRRVPARWDGGRGRLSLVAVEDLARLVTSLATAPDAVPSGTFHAGHPVPVRSGDLMARLAELDVLPPVTAELPWAQCLERFREAPGRISERQFALLALDHWYESEEIWRLAGCAPGPGPLERLAGAAPWYRAHLADA